MGSFGRAFTPARRFLNSKAIATSTGKGRSTIPGFSIGSETLQLQLSPCYQNQHANCLISRSYSTNSNSQFLDIDLSNEESKRRLFNRLLYRSKQRGFPQLELILVKWVEDHIHSMDADGIKALIHVIDMEDPDLWKWLSGQEQPPESVKANPVFNAVQDKVANNLNKHAAPETRASPGQTWVTGWDDYKRRRGNSPLMGYQ